jgi:transposase
LRGVGATITRISAELGADRKTVHSWLKLGRAPAWAQPSGDSILDPFKSFLGRRWSEGCRNATQLWRELLTLGFREGSSIVRDWAATLFARFAASLRRDFDAISAALVTPWTTSPVEGQISRLKMLKRTMYGRAGFELLRARVLNPA